MRTRRNRTAPTAVALLAALLTVAAVAPAAAAAASGTTTIALRGAALQSLRAQGATIAARWPARIVTGKLRLPVRQGVVGSDAVVNLGGSLTFRRGQRALRVTRLQVRLGRTGVRLAGTIGAARVTLFTGTKRPSLNATVGAASLSDAQLTITRTAAQMVKRSLKLRRLPVGGVGRATVTALVTTPGTGTGPTPVTPVAPASTAIAVTSASIAWHVRDSWVRYVDTSTVGGTSGVGGAVGGAPITPGQHPCSDAAPSVDPGPLVYSFSLPFARGWHDPASGQTTLTTSGGVRFHYPEHGIDLQMTDLEVELNGATSRVTASINGQRTVLVALASGGLAPGAPAALVRGSLPAGGSTSTFAGFYPAGAGFGCFTIAYTT